MFINMLMPTYQESTTAQYYFITYSLRIRLSGHNYPQLLLDCSKYCKQNKREYLSKSVATSLKTQHLTSIPIFLKTNGKFKKCKNMR